MTAQIHPPPHPHHHPPPPGLGRGAMTVKEKDILLPATSVRKKVYVHGIEIVVPLI
ncbi:MAG: hypothetical protein WCP92_04465 [bacterium]